MTPQIIPILDSAPAPQSALAPPKGAAYAPATPSVDAADGQAAPSAALRAAAEAEEAANRGVDVAEERAKELAQKLVDDALKPFARLEISRNEESGQFIYKTIDDRTGDIIREWPRESALRTLAESGDSADQTNGVVVDRKV